MRAYLPHDPGTVGPVLALLLATLLVGFAVTRLRSLALGRLAGWLLVVAAPLAVHGLTLAGPAGFRMVMLILALLFAMKVLVTVEAEAEGRPRLSPGRWFAFTTLWLGMRPGLFLEVGTQAKPGAGSLIQRGLMGMICGLALALLARGTWLGSEGWSDLARRLTVTILLLPALSLLLHFGLMNIMAGAWRWAGAETSPLFRAPLEARSLTAFWGQRWNLAFAEMSAATIYRPVSRRLGRAPAMLLAFVASGLFHEVAISVPVQAGYGLPLLYFLLHGVLVLVEQRLARGGHPITARPLLGRLWVLLWLVLPLPILFHPWFLRGVVWPLVGIPPE